MNKIGRFFEIAYGVIGVVFIVDGISRLGAEREKAYVMIGFGIVAVFMFFFKRNFRNKRS